MGADEPSEPGDIDAFREIRIRLHGRIAALARKPLPRLVRFRADQSLGHEAEALGIPRIEIGRALADGAEWPLALPAPDGSLVELFPLPEPLPIRGTPRFACDLHLGRLARTLRLLGFDVAWRNDIGAAELIELRLGEGRFILTRDRRLVYRAPISRGHRGSQAGPRGFQAGPRGPLAGADLPSAMLLLSTDPYEQTLEVCRRFGLAGRFAPMSRCSACGDPIRAIDKAKVRAFLPARVGERYDEFFECPSCGKLFWKGDHFRNIEPFLARLAEDLN